MATSSSDESLTAPKDFHLSSSLDSGSRNSPIPQKCPLCWNFRKKFYCRECIYNGEFCHSNSTERYIDKKLRLREIVAAKKSYENTCLPLLEKRQDLDELSSSIRHKREWIRILQNAVKEKKERQVLLKNELIDIRHKNEKMSKSLPKYEEKVEELGCYVEGKEEKIKKAKMELEKKQRDLKQLTRVRIKQLIEYIFPITLVQPKIEIESSSSDMVSALAEATHTTYISDRWVYTDNSGELQHCIVAPTLPGTGNYSAYNVWVVQNKDSVPSSHSTTAVEHNSAYNISAALTYTAQLVNVLAFYLDIRLLHKMSYSDLCGSDMKEQTFARRVARLNANILQLCFSQSTNLESLHSAHTLHNIMQLIDPSLSDLGRKGPVEVDAQMANSLEEQLTPDLYTSETSDSEECDALPNEWEAVPHVQCPEVPAGAVIAPTTQMTTTQQASSMAGGLVVSAAASIASIWRGWTGR
ncbi:hypothetical protein PPYR_00823 [Photinus pyralis]|uniref:Beclin 1-associated autophagy-related key regulator n=2 Tax=Photinus pyralis TaxID=7054 RepID=A0A5N4B2S6_PHOPY|nr:beclin 1-associated autophagy-related key regulator-like [Photinus pyralis]KAB0803853.1 hypothetical protein PPYR_00823 [Photinus pyralis]